MCGQRPEIRRRFVDTGQAGALTGPLAVTSTATMTFAMAIFEFGFICHFRCLSSWGSNRLSPLASKEAI